MDAPPSTGQKAVGVRATIILHEVIFKAISAPLIDN